MEEPSINLWRPLHNNKITKSERGGSLTEPCPRGLQKEGFRIKSQPRHEGSMSLQAKRAHNKTTFCALTVQTEMV